MHPPIHWTKNKITLISAATCILIAALLLTIACITGGGNPMLGIKLIFGAPLTVDKDIPTADITQFYHTVSTSTNPPHYQRYHFYKEDNTYYFFHETREGNHWPLTEADATVTGTIRLNDAQWSQLLDHLSGGTVRKRGNSASSGSSGPWLYLYWTQDQGEIQEFTFVTLAQQSSFEAFCRQLLTTAP